MDFRSRDGIPVLLLLLPLLLSLGFGTRGRVDDCDRVRTLNSPKLPERDAGSLTNTLKVVNAKIYLKYLVVLCAGSQCEGLVFAKYLKQRRKAMVSPACEKMSNDVVTIAEMQTRGGSFAIWQESYELESTIAITTISHWQLYEELLAETDV